MERVFEAIEFAVRAHRGQFRKGTKIPYIVHPIGVMQILAECNVPENVIIAGVLHDTVEDTPITLDEIKKAFGEEVARIVESVSEPDKSQSWEVRKTHTLQYLERAPLDVLLVALADKLDNARSILRGERTTGKSFWERFNRPRSAQKWYYKSLIHIFSLRKEEIPCPHLVNELVEAVKKIFGEDG